MKIAFVYPEIYEIAKFGTRRKEFPPFGVMYLAASVEQVGIEVKLLKISSEKTTIDFQEFDIVAFSTPSSVTYPLVKACRFTSVYSESCLIVVGGIHASIYPQQTLLDLKADIVSLGEGEITILEIIDKFKTRNFEKIQGICYLLNSNPVFTHPRPLLDNIDVLPFPARHLLDQDDFIINNRLAKTDLRMTHIMFSRGCPFSCNYCAAPQKKVQYRSGENIRKELVLLKKEYGIEGFSIVDDNSIINKKKLSEICNSIADLGLKWITLSRVDTVDKNILEQMRDAGCIEIAFGAESGSQKILNAMNKKISTEQIIVAVKMAHSVKIDVKLFLVHGYPGENAETTKETLNLLEKVAPLIHRVSLFRFVPLPGSYVYHNYKNFNLNINDEDYASVDWSKYHIHNNNYHWWGTKDDFDEMNTAYEKLSSFVQATWPSRHENEYQQCPNLM